MSQRLIQTGERSGLQTAIVMTGSVSMCVRQQNGKECAGAIRSKIMSKDIGLRSYMRLSGALLKSGRAKSQI